MSCPHPRRFRSLLRVFAIAALAAMASSSAARAQSPAMAGYPAAGEPAVVTVVSPGAEPRRTLRYVVPPPHRAMARMSMGMTMATRMPDEKRSATVPTMFVDFDLDVTGTNPDGSITYDMAFTSVDVDGTSADPAVVEAVRAALSGLVGLTGSATISDRGATRAVRFDVERVQDPQMRQAMAQVSSSVDQLSIPLPEEAVGVGARWEARQTIVSDGIHIFQSTAFELESIDGPVVVLRTNVEQTAPRQVLDAAAVPTGTKMRIDRVNGSGAGTVVTRLDALVPQSRVETSTSMAMTASIAGRPAPMQVDLRLLLTVAPTR